MAEEPLEGGIANAGQVVRVGPHVLRPSTPHTASIHAFLRAVRRAGFEGAPLPVGVDEDGRERLEFIVVRAAPVASGPVTREPAAVLGIDGLSHAGWAGI
jgi:hypothetical protein